MEVARFPSFGRTSFACQTSRQQGNPSRLRRAIASIAEIGTPAIPLNEMGVSLALNMTLDRRVVQVTRHLSGTAVLP
jgi:hypothetical protein